jgi:DNA helicase IV
MMNKEKILSQARAHLVSVCAIIKKSLDKTEKSLEVSRERFSSLSYADQMVETGVMDFNEKRIGELKHLEGSPYFVRCDVLFNAEDKEETVYFAKFGFNKKAIYSWVAPASVMRFEKPGPVSYRRPDGRIQKIQLLRKDQYMIVDGKIKFLSTEAIDAPRVLVYEEYFSTQKSGFILPEIVAQMEKAQDQVIRAYHVGPFLISGPAGSGKTTLALHRVAYLAQSPDLAHIFTSKSIIVFVQDNGTREYFSHLLPELGIDDVLITTFSEWALRILDIDGAFIDRYGDSEQEKDLYEFQKLKALKNLARITYSKNQIASVLEKAYGKFFDQKQKKLFHRQMEADVFDRIDLALLLKLFRKKYGCLSIIKDYRVEGKDGIVRDKREIVPLKYSLAVADEFQNYLPDQLKLIRSCIDEKTQAVVYVGDMAQQVRLGTIRKWEEMEEKMEGERKVVLEKVYRNTKNILTFIKKLGYAIEIPEQLKEGAEVGEYVLESKEQEIEKIKEIIGKENFGSVGILAKEDSYLEEFKEAFGKDEKIHVMTMNDAQGVEFDGVIIVGINREMFASHENVQKDLADEKKRINKDLLYVALTRAISQLHVMGGEKLESIIFHY